MRSDGTLVLIPFIFYPPCVTLEHAGFVDSGSYQQMPAHLLLLLLFNNSFDIVYMLFYNSCIIGYQRPPDPLRLFGDGVCSAIPCTAVALATAIKAKHPISNPRNAFCRTPLQNIHTMRRTAITVMLSPGVREQVVRKISGHAAGSKKFYRYVSFAQTYQDPETEKMFDKLKGKQFQVA
jgi:hypothetical protein